MMRRRDLIKEITTSAAAWPIAAFAQQSAIPVIGFLSFRSANEAAGSEKAFREALADIGYVDGQSVHIAFRWAEGHSDRLPVLASDLVDNLHVAVLAATGGGSSALVAKAATKTIPIVFTFERALAERAVGYSVDVEECFVIGGQVVRETVRKYYPPDVTACIYWTKNRMPEKWRDVQRHEVNAIGLKSAEELRQLLAAEFKDLVDQGILVLPSPDKKIKEINPKRPKADI
jgi:hypothetical protein